MKIRIMLVALVAFAISGMAQAGLWDPAISDPSFESVEGGTPHGDLGGWGYNMDDWFENENPNSVANFWEKGSAIGLVGDGDIWAGAETGGAFYQAIGTVDDGATYTVTAWIGARWGTSFGTGSFSLYAGGAEADGADAVLLDSFATELDSVEVTVTDGTEVSTDVYEVSVELSTGSGHSGELLWLEVKSVSGKDYFDNISIISPADLKAKVPDPGDGALDVDPDQITLTWVAPGDYVPTGYDAYLGTDANELSLDYFGNNLVVDNEDVTSYGPVDLDYETTYFWQVDAYDPNNGDPVVRYGDVWTFTTDIHPALKDRTGRDDLAVDVSLMNPSFESITATLDDGPSWGYEIDYWYEGYTDGSYTRCFWEVGSEIGLESDLDLWAGTETEGTFYQLIGTVTPGAEYEVRMLIGNRAGSAFGTGSASLFAGPDGAGPGIMLESFATELSTASFTMADGINVSTNVNEAGVVLSIPADATGGEILWLRIKGESGKNYYDNIRFYKPIDTRAAWGPSPAVGDSGVGVLEPELTLLGWQGSVDVDNDYAPLAVDDYEVYVDADKDGVLEYIGNTGGAAELTVTVPSDSTILWRVDTIIGAETIQGRTWSFDTELLLATITEQPADVVIDDGDEASFSVSVDSYSPETYIWYDGDDAVVGSGSTYTIPSATLAAGDEGIYYCKVNNDAGDVYTRDAYLTIKRRMGYWDFEGDLVSEDNAAHAGVVASNNFTDDAASGQAWQFLGDPNVIVIDNSAEDFNFYPQGYSISAWVKTTQSEVWGAYVTKQSTAGGKKGIILTHNGVGSAVSSMRESLGDLFSGNVELNDGEWHHVVGTYNAQTGMGEIFVDGEYKAEAGPNFDALTLHDEPLFFGAETTAGATAYVGLLDEVKIWNYALDGFEVAAEFFGIMPGADTICVDPGELEFDVTGPEGVPDCKVGLNDFAAFAAKWLDCNRMPADRCL